MTDRHTYLVHNKYCSHAPANALVIAYPLGTPYYFSISRTDNGLIPGFSKGGDAVYAYGGKEHTTNDFDWIVVDHTGEVLFRLRDKILQVYSQPVTL